MKKNIEELRERKIKLMKLQNKCSKALLKNKYECGHDVVLLLKDSKKQSLGVYACPLCGRCYHTSDFNSLDNPFRESNILDFSNNPIATSLSNGKYVIGIAVKTALIEASNSNPNMTILEFMESIPSDWYTSESALRGKIKEKKITE